MSKKKSKTKQDAAEPADNVTLLWVHRKGVPEVNGQTGFVKCPESVAAKLVDRKDAQRPNIGASNFEFIEGEHPSEQRARQIGKPRQEPTKKAKVRKVQKPDETSDPILESE